MISTKANTFYSFLAKILEARQQEMREIDLQIQQHIRNLKWISSKDLMCPIDLYLPEVPPLLLKAIKGVIVRLLK